MSEISTSASVDALITKQLNFSAFVAHCAGHFVRLERGALPDSFPLPDSDWVQQQRDRLDMLRALDSGEQIRERAIQSLTSRLAQARQEHKQVLAMQKLVLEWEPPSEDHQPLKRVMLEELQAALDCAAGLIPAFEADLHNAITMSAHEHWEQAISEAEDTLRFSTQRLAKEDQEHEKRSRWLRLLRESLAS